MTKIYNLTEEDDFENEQGQSVKLKTGRVTAEDEGFKEIVQTVKLERPIAGEITEVGFARGDIPIEGSKLEPNNMIYVVRKHEGKEGWQAIIFVPFDPARVNELQRWVRDFATKKIAGWTVIFGILWVSILVLLVFGD